MSPSRQTQSYLRTLFGQRGIAPQHRYGQNFLIDLNIHELITRTAELTASDVVLEVGPGAGALTSLMAEEAGAVVAVDIDPAMAELTRNAVAGFPNVRVFHRDALAGKHALDPTIVDSLRAGLAVGSERRLKLVANLPFNAATPLISNLLVHPRLHPTRLVVTIQRELADRLLAPPQTEHYGALSVLVQALADVQLIRVLSPKVFWPRPKVESAIVLIVPSQEKRERIDDLPWFHALVRTMFLHRRKNLRGVLFSAWREIWTKSEVDTLLECIGLTGEIRAESLNVDEWIDLADAVKTRLGPEIVAKTEIDLGMRSWPGSEGVAPAAGEPPTPA
jgi:16S rRNA (adenine1518-N6/adenine1519-N6)-dimethyltransferase